MIKLQTLIVQSLFLGKTIGGNMFYRKVMRILYIERRH